MPQSSSHLASANKSLCNSSQSWSLLISLQTMASSAKRPVLDVTHSGKSLMNIQNKRGPKRVPCGTPLTTGALSEVSPSTMTCCDLSERNALIQLSVVPLIPYKSSFESSRQCGTLSKAFEKSKMIGSCWIPLSSDLASSCVKVKSCVSQLLLARKPCWQSVSMVFRSRCFKKLLVSMCSCTLQHRQVRETGR